MNEIKRYEHVVMPEGAEDDDCYYEEYHVEKPDGDWCKWEDVEPVVKELKQLKAEFSKFLSESKRCCELGIEWVEICNDFGELERLKKMLS